MKVFRIHVQTDRNTFLSAMPPAYPPDLYAHNVSVTEGCALRNVEHNGISKIDGRVRRGLTRHRRIDAWLCLDACFIESEFNAHLSRIKQRNMLKESL